jgi:hypothetical protein
MILSENILLLHGRNDETSIFHIGRILSTVLLQNPAACPKGERLLHCLDLTAVDFI